MISEIAYSYSNTMAVRRSILGGSNLILETCDLLSIIVFRLGLDIGRDVLERNLTVAALLAIHIIYLQLEDICLCFGAAFVLHVSLLTSCLFIRVAIMIVICRRRRHVTR
jgi:hypothetical protein